MDELIAVGVLAAVLIIIIYFSRKLPPETYANWHCFLDGLEYSSEDFYTKVRELIGARKIEKLEFYRITKRERGAFSSKRIYLQLEWRNITYDIGAFYFGGGFCISAWQYETSTGGEAFVRKIPLIGGWLHRSFYPVTYYTIDTATMYRHCVHTALLEVVDGITSEKGLRSLTEAERKPQLNDIFKRK